jgi:ferrochelatase
MSDSNSTAPDSLGVLLINTGSPDAPEVPETRRYLRQFLSDPRVIDISPVARWLLVNLIILPTRPRTSAAAYKSIWTPDGSPLIVNSRKFRDSLRDHLPAAHIEIGMAYGRPSIADGMNSLRASGATRILLVPMFPQYASATVGSVLEFAYKAAAREQNVPMLSVVPPFYEQPEFLDAWARVARMHLDSFNPDHVVVSYHGLPERHIFKADPTGSHCLKSETCCDRYVDGNPMCYRAHCMATTRGIASRLGWKPQDYTVAFQSKLGRDPWLTPAADATVARLAKSGVRRLAVLSPAFVADCIETIEELGEQVCHLFHENGGKDFLLIPSLNADPTWADGFAQILRRHGA